MPKRTKVMHEEAKIAKLIKPMHGGGKAARKGKTGKGPILPKY